MNLKGLNPGTRIVTSSGDVAELLEVGNDGSTAHVRYVEVLPGSDAKAQSEAHLPAEDVATIEGNRFVGPGRTASSSR